MDKRLNSFPNYEFNCQPDLFNISIFINNLILVFLDMHKPH